MVVVVVVVGVGGLRISYKAVAGRWKAVEEQVLAAAKLLYRSWRRVGAVAAGRNGRESLPLSTTGLAVGLPVRP